MGVGYGQVLDPSHRRHDFAGVTAPGNFDYDFDYDYDNDSDNDNDYLRYCEGQEESGSMGAGLGQPLGPGPRRDAGLHCPLPTDAFSR